MTEWLTTGQMIDRLKVGEVAEGKNNGWKVKYNRKLDLIIVENVEDVEGDRFLTNAVWVESDKWRIFPKYVSFEEAVQAVRDGKTPYLHVDGKKIAFFQKTNFQSINTAWNLYLTLGDLLNGEWTIEEDKS